MWKQALRRYDQVRWGHPGFKRGPNPSGHAKCPRKRGKERTDAQGGACEDRGAEHAERRPRGGRGPAPAGLDLGPPDREGIKVAVSAAAALCPAASDTSRGTLLHPIPPHPLRVPRAESPGGTGCGQGRLSAPHPSAWIAQATVQTPCGLCLLICEMGDLAEDQLSVRQAPGGSVLPLRPRERADQLHSSSRVPSCWPPGTPAPRPHFPAEETVRGRAQKASPAAPTAPASWGPGGSCRQCPSSPTCRGPESQPP